MFSASLGELLVSLALAISYTPYMYIILWNKFRKFHENNPCSDSLHNGACQFLVSTLKVWLSILHNVACTREKAQQDKRTEAQYHFNINCGWGVTKCSGECMLSYKQRLLFSL